MGYVSPELMSLTLVNVQVPEEQNWHTAGSLRVNTLKMSKLGLQEWEDKKRLNKRARQKLK